MPEDDHRNGKYAQRVDTNITLWSFHRGEGANTTAAPGATGPGCC